MDDLAEETSWLPFTAAVVGNAAEARVQLMLKVRSSDPGWEAQRKRNCPLSFPFNGCILFVKTLTRCLLSYRVPWRVLHQNLSTD